MRYLFVGDTHGDMNVMESALQYAARLTCDEVIQVGDWGFWWPGSDQSERLSAMLKHYGLRMRFCDGNHDDHLRLHPLPPVENNLAPNITFQHRGSIHEDSDGCRFLFLGGAPSIDKTWRLKMHAPWWPEEEITEEDMDKVMAHRGTPVHVLVTHDSANPPPGIKDTSDIWFTMKSRWSQSCIKKTIRSLHPRLNVHGHYHCRYSDKVLETVIEGLGSNLGSFEDLVYVFEYKKEST